MKSITAIIPVRKNSQRVKNKNTKPFGNTTLLELKLKALMNIKTYLKEIVVSSDCDYALQIASNFGLKTHRRDPYFASSKATNSEFFKNLAESIDFKNILYSPVTTPFVKKESFVKSIKLFDTTRNVVTTYPVKHHMWLNGIPLNYDIKKSPNSQDLPNIQKITYGICLISKEDMLNYQNVVCDNPTFLELTEIEALDIDTELDFKFSEFVYNQIQGRL